MSSPQAEDGLSSQEFIRLTKELEAQIARDDDASDNIKELASCVRILAGAVDEMCQAINELDGCVGELAKRPIGRTVNFVKYRK